LSIAWHILHFLIRIGMGIAFSIAVTSPRQVTSGFFRIHLWVVMAISVLASLVAWSVDGGSSSSLSGSVTWVAVLVAVASYLAASCWIYEARRAGRSLTVLATLLAGLLVVITAGGPGHAITLEDWPRVLGAMTAGLLVGTTTAAMLLGHWYLNAPGMQLGPLRRLLVLVLASIALRSLVCGYGLLESLQADEAIPSFWWIFVSFRWLAGILGTLILTLMAWLTLRVPNTQSATGILYAATVLAMLGELASQLLSHELLYHL
jgi:hypothetical protein